MKLTITVDLFDDGKIHVYGPLDDHRQLCEDILKEAVKVVQNHKERRVVVLGSGETLDRRFV